MAIIPRVVESQRLKCAPDAMKEMKSEGYHGKDVHPRRETRLEGNLEVVIDGSMFEIWVDRAKGQMQ